MLTTAANVASLILIAHMAVIIVLVLVVGIGTLKAMMVLNSKLRIYMPQFQGYARQLSRGTESVSQRVASPFLNFESKQAGRAAMRSRATRPASRLASRAGLININHASHQKCLCSNRTPRWHFDRCPARRAHQLGLRLGRRKGQGDRAAERHGLLSTDHRHYLLGKAGR